MKAPERMHNIIALDCCEHILTVLETLKPHTMTCLNSVLDQKTVLSPHKYNLVVIGMSPAPISHVVLNQIRHVFNSPPILILREESNDIGNANVVRGEFVISDQYTPDDWKTIEGARSLLPFPGCTHSRGNRDGLVRAVHRVVLKRYSDPALDLSSVARELAISPKRISRILNSAGGTNFRRLLRKIRLEQATRMLTPNGSSVKSVALRVGFADSSYFSRSFKEWTGLKPTEFRSLRSKKDACSADRLFSSQSQWRNNRTQSENI